MPCDTRRRRDQTLEQRKEEIKATVTLLDKAIAAGKVKPIIDKRTGAIAFQGWPETERNAITDACAFRRLMVQGGSLTKAAIARAEQLAGRQVDKQALAQGVHSHDGGNTWHHGH
jgi:hypothetical protein